MTTISIVTPCLNAERFLRATIESVTAQRDSVSLEYVVADGGSTDGTLRLVAEYGDRIDRVLSEGDDGLYDGIAKAFAATGGEIMGWLNADDVYFPWTLSHVAAIFDALPEVEWISSLSPTVIDADGDILRVHKIAGLSHDAFLDGVYIGLDHPDLPMGTWFLQQEGTFWRRSLWERAGGADVIRRRRVAGDFALWCAFLRHAAPVGVEAPLAMWRWHDGQLSQTRRALYLEESLEALSALRSDTERRRPPADIGDCGRPYRGRYLAKRRGGLPPWTVDERTFHVLPKSKLKSLCLEYMVF